MQKASSHLASRLVSDHAGMCSTPLQVAQPNPRDEYGPVLCEAVREFEQFIACVEPEQITRADRTHLRDLMKQLSALLDRSS